jgi:hypothetical protein
LVVPGDGKALAILDLDGTGRPGFLASRNGTTSLAFRPNPQLVRQWHRVRLQGETGNVSAIGARVTAEYSDGARETLEIHAGSGAYSQSTSTLFFGSTQQHSLTRVKVRWPSGGETASADNPPVSTEIRLTTPSR